MLLFRGEIKFFSQNKLLNSIIFSGFTVNVGQSEQLCSVKLNSGLASREVKTENSNVVIFVKIIKEKLTKLLLNFV